MDDDSFLPKDEVDKLKKEIEMLKKKQGIDEPEHKDSMKDSMVILSRSINSLIQIFKEASEDLKMDTHDAVLVSQKLDSILDRLEKIETQNEKIAKGIVAVADMMEDMPKNMPLPQRASPVPKPMPEPYNFQNQPGHQMPQPMQSQQTQPLPSYNLPRQDDKKKGFLSFKI
ncbi:hypothetical protein JXC34_04545 [Candidatus Woesearchaeota archaeon]|nr:hypothetical protein [Candidatus Woesearchaeota archaeon]